MVVTSDFLDWTRKRPIWQQDALRRIVTKGHLAEEDITELLTICKEQFGLRDLEEPSIAPIPLDNSHLRGTGPQQSTSLLAIKNVCGVNLLAPKQELSFQEKGMTIVYGDNASGKTGYTRILRNTCSYRGRLARILPNVFINDEQEDQAFSDEDQDRNDDGNYYNKDEENESEDWGELDGRGVASENREGGFNQSAEIVYKAGQSETFHWEPGLAQPDELTQVRIFDSDSAFQYVESQNDFAFRPLELSVLEELSRVADELRATLYQERTGYGKSLDQWADFIPETVVGEALSNLHAEAKLVDVMRLAELSQDDQARYKTLGGLIKKVKAEDSQVQLVQLNRRKQRINNKLQALLTLENAVSSETLKTMSAFGREAIEAAKASQSAVKALSDILALKEGVGGNTWRRMWDAAKEYSETFAYEGRHFPSTHNGARCVLCQQTLSPEAVRRMTALEKYLNEQAQTTAKSAAEKLQKVKDAFNKDVSQLDSIEEFVEDVWVEDEELADLLERHFKDISNDVTRIRNIMDSTNWANLDRGQKGSVIPKIKQLILELDKQIKDFEKAEDPEELKKLAREYAELDSRVQLGKATNRIKEQLRILQVLAVYDRCLTDTETYSISWKSTDLAEMQKKELCEQFDRQISMFGGNLGRFGMEFVGSQKGVPYYRIKIKGISKYDVRDIVSEGEHRILALCAFLSELATGSNSSCLVFDDPVSSLDLRWHEALAERLAKESVNRQLIVFSHDLVFTMFLSDAARAAGVTVETRQLIAKTDETGVPASGLPYNGLNTEQRVSHLKRVILHEMRTRYKDLSEDPVAYQFCITVAYKMLRDAWERAVEEVFLNDVVKRFRKSVETQRLRNVPRFKEQDYRDIEKAMARCSNQCHDQAPALGSIIPSPDDFAADVEVLRSKVEEFRKRKGE